MAKNVLRHVPDPIQDNCIIYHKVDLQCQSLTVTVATLDPKVN